MTPPVIHSSLWETLGTTSEKGGTRRDLGRHPRRTNVRNRH